MENEKKGIGKGELIALIVSSCIGTGIFGITPLSAILRRTCYRTAGQIQRVEIARALLSGRPILLADEATSALDPNLSLAIHKTLLKNQRIAVIEVAHKISLEEKAMFDKIVQLDKHRIEIPMK